MTTARGLQSLALVLTPRCNLSCSYCYENDKKPGRMSWETLQAGLDLLLQSDHEVVDLLFYGGEPLLEFPLIRRAVGVVKRRGVASPLVRFSLITNGTLMRPRIAEFLAANRIRTQLSFDGLPAMQDLRGKGTFGVLDGLLDDLRQRHRFFFESDLRISITLTAATVPYLAESVNYFLSKQVASIGISPATTPGTDWPPERIEELDRQFARIDRACRRRFRKTGEIAVELLRRTAGPPARVRRKDVCGVTRAETLTVDVDGSVFGCLTFADSYQKFRTAFLRERLEPLRMGDLRAPEFPRRLAMYPQAARDAELFTNHQDKYSSYGRCRDCRYLAGCTVCPVTIGDVPGNTDPNRIPDFPCAFNLVSLKYQARFPALPDPYESVARSGGGSPALERLRQALRS